MPTGRSIQNWASPGIEALFMALLSYCQKNGESDTFHCHFIRKWLKPKPIAVHNQRKSLPNASFVSHTHRVQGSGGPTAGYIVIFMALWSAFTFRAADDILWRGPCRFCRLCLVGTSLLADLAGLMLFVCPLSFLVCSCCS